MNSFRTICQFTFNPFMTEAVIYMITASDMKGLTGFDYCVDILTQRTLFLFKIDRENE